MLDKQLLVTSGDYGRMILVPAFEGPTAVSVYGSAFTDEYPKQPWSFHITVTKANKSRGSRLKITRLDVSIDREFAVAIQRAWATMLLNTRYPQKSRFVMDGYTAEFSVFVRGAGILYGRIQTPETGLPKEFVEIGLDLVASMSGVAQAIGNVGPGLTPEIGPVGNFAGLADGAKWLLSLAMILGRLELLTMLVLLSRTYWRG